MCSCYHCLLAAAYFHYALLASGISPALFGPTTTRVSSFTRANTASPLITATPSTLTRGVAQYQPWFHIFHPLQRQLLQREETQLPPW